jgi:hypothetical protein
MGQPEPFGAYPVTWLAALAFGKRAVSALWTWLAHRSFWQLVSLALACVIVVMHFTLADARHDLDAWHRQFDAEHAGRLADRASYQQAQKDAAAQNQAQVAAVEQQYQRNSDETNDAYARDHAELVRLRKQRDEAAKGSSGGSGSSHANPASGGADGDGVQVPPADDLQKTRDDAADIELRLMHLQNYVDGLLKVDPNQ